MRKARKDSKCIHAENHQIIKGNRQNESNKVYFINIYFCCVFTEGVHRPWCACAGQRATSDLSPSLPMCLRQSLSGLLPEDSPVSPSCLVLGMLRLLTYATTFHLHMGSVGQNSGCQICA